MQRPTPGIGELLRYLGEVIDSGSEERYRELGLDYRPRYTPVLRAIADGASTVTEIRDRSHLTQGAVSQTLALMADAGIVTRHELPDRRKTDIRLTAAGKELLSAAKMQWHAIFLALDELEKEIGQPIRATLEAAIEALSRRGFADRLRAAQEPENGKVANGQ